MTKYKAGTIKINIPKYIADALNDGSGILIYPRDIISHDPAPEPITRYINIYENEIFGGKHETSYSALKEFGSHRAIGQIKITIMGNYFTVEKVKHDR